MAVSKNNPNIRSRQRLIVRCPECKSEMETIKRVGIGQRGMFYVCPKDDNSYQIVKGSYKQLPHEWVRK